VDIVETSDNWTVSDEKSVVIEHRGGDTMNNFFTTPVGLIVISGISLLLIGGVILLIVKW